MSSMRLDVAHLIFFWSIFLTRKYILLYKNVYLYIDKCIKKEGVYSPSVLLSTSIIIPCFFISSHRVITSGVAGYRILVPSANIYHTLFILLTPLNSHDSAMPCYFHVQVCPVCLASVGSGISVREIIGDPFFHVHILLSWGGDEPRPGCFIRAESTCFHRIALSDCRNDAQPAEENGFSFCLFSTLEAVERALTHLLSKWI